MYTESNGISITNMCYQCQALTELCPDCLELKDSRDIDIAHQIVDDGNLQYKFVWSQTTPEVSGHDWVGAITRLPKPAVLPDGTLIWERYEFTEAVSSIADRLYDIETSLTVTANETICETCHLVYNKATHCPNCN
jgi:hypothetical protein